MYVDEETGEIYQAGPWDASDSASTKFKEENLYVLPVLFAGTRTCFKDSKTHEFLYTGDVVSVKNNRTGQVITAGLGVYFNKEQYALLLDNHALLLSSEQDFSYYSAGSLFYHLDREPYPTNIEGYYIGYAQSMESHKTQRALIKSSPCYKEF